jgi:phage terminase small subunit
MTNGFNATRAYMSAYPDSKYTSADASARNLLEDARIKAEIERRQEENRKKYEITKEEIIEVVKSILFENRKGGQMYSLKAAEILNKMMGFNAVEKQEINVTQNREIPLFPDVDYDEEKQ